MKAFTGSVFAMAVAGMIGVLTHQPWLFPSLGPTVMLHVEKPDAPESSPRDTLIGHAVALLAGYGLLAGCGLLGHPSALQEGVGVPRIVAAAGSLAATAVVLLMLRVSHPPAGATTLLVSLGLLHTPTQLAVAMASVVLVTVVDWGFTRMIGRPGRLGRSSVRRIAVVDRIADPWGPRTPYGPGERWPVRVDAFLEPSLTEDNVDGWYQSASVLHSNGDAMDIAVKDGRIVGVRGRAVDRVNHGRLGPKDLYGCRPTTARTG